MFLLVVRRVELCSPHATAETLQVHAGRGNSYRSDIYGERDRRSRYKATSHTFSKKHNNRFMLFYFMPKSQEISWPFQRLCVMEFPLNECTSFLLQISDFMYGWSKQIFWGIRSVCPHKKLLLSFYCFLNECHSSHCISLPCNANGKQKVK